MGNENIKLKRSTSTLSPSNLETMGQDVDQTCYLKYSPSFLKDAVYFEDQCNDKCESDSNIASLLGRINSEKCLKSYK